MKIEYLVSRLSIGDHRAFMEIYDLYLPQLTVFIKRYVHSEETAQDLVQDVFVKLWEKHSFLENVQNFNAYLYRIAKNHTIDYLKKVSRVEIMPHEIIKEFNFSSNEVELMVTEQDYFKFLDQYMEQLPERSQIIFNLCREHEQSYEEVARKLNISTNTVKHHMVTTMKKLKHDFLDKLNIKKLKVILLFHFFYHHLPF